MLLIGQVVKNVVTGDRAVYAGFNNSVDAMLSQEGAGFYVFTPDEVCVNPDDYTHIKGKDGNPVLGAFVKRIGSLGYFGRIDPSTLSDEDWDAVRKTCEG